MSAFPDSDFTGLIEETEDEEVMGANI